MALLNCPECSGKFSSTAHACPACGFRLKRLFSISNYLRTFINIFLCFIFIIAAASVVRKFFQNASASQTLAMTANQQAAREKIGKLCLPYSRASFLERIREKDYLAVQLFLQTGLTNQTLDNTGKTAHEIALETGDSEMAELLSAEKRHIDSLSSPHKD